MLHRDKIGPCESHNNTLDIKASAADHGRHMGNPCSPQTPPAQQLRVPLTALAPERKEGGPAATGFEIKQ